MEVTQQVMIDDTVTMILLNGIDDRCLDSLNSIAASAVLSEAFVKTLVARKTDAGKPPDDVLPETQQFFEQITGSSKSTACTFMAHLWPIASRQAGLHDVCDSIDLWLENNNGPEIAEHLKYIALFADHELTREHFRQIVAVRSR